MEHETFGSGNKTERNNSESLNPVIFKDIIAAQVSYFYYRHEENAKNDDYFLSRISSTL